MEAFKLRRDDGLPLRLKCTSQKSLNASPLCSTLAIAPRLHLIFPCFVVPNREQPCPSIFSRHFLAHLMGPGVSPAVAFAYTYFAPNSSPPWGQVTSRMASTGRNGGHLSRRSDARDGSDGHGRTSSCSYRRTRTGTSCSFSSLPCCSLRS